MGGTHFSKAFGAIRELLQDTLPALRTKYDNNLAVVIAFMTDGADSEGTESGTSIPKWETSLKSLKAFLRSNPLMAGIASTFHSLAFGAGHDFGFLDNLRATAGTVEGGFQYAEPTDGAAAFKTKLDNIVSSASAPAVTTQLRLRVPGYLTNIGSTTAEKWVDGSSPSDTLHEPALFPSRATKIVFNLVVKKEGDSSASSDAGVQLTDLPVSAATSTAAPTSSIVTDSPASVTTNEYITPVNTSAGITYATDYYGFSMPAFPQPGMSHSSDLYASDPYASTSFQFGPQPGMSQAASDFGPQPGSSAASSVTTDASSAASQTDATASSSSGNSGVASNVSAPTPFNKVKSTNPNESKEAEIGVEYIDIEAFQIRTDRLADGIRTATLKVRVDRLHRPVDCSILTLQQMKINLERMRTEITQAMLQQAANAGARWTAYNNIIAKYEKQVNGNSESLISLGRTKRQAINEASEEIRSLFTELHGLLATAAKGEMSTSQLARLAEVAHGAQFTKARRGRMMDARATENAERLAKEQKAFNALQISEDEVTDLVYSPDRDSDDAEKLLREWFCVLSQENWYNLLLNEKDCIGFGIALRRPEYVVDDPTAVRVLDISLTCVSKSAFEHVLTHKLIQASKSPLDPIQAKLAYLGGFNVQGKDLGVVVRGSANEPINAWLPLYINEHHWRVASAQFQSITGFLVTNTPLGYNFNQLSVYFMILAIMIVRMKVASHRQVELTVQYLRTCIAIAEDKGYRARMKKAIESFYKSPAKRLKDELPNLLVLLGYMLALPKGDLEDIFPRASDWAAYWLYLSGEVARRALDACSRTAQLGNDAANYFRNLVSRLVDGYRLERELTPEELERVFSPEEQLAGADRPAPLPRAERTFANFSASAMATPQEEKANLDKKKQEEASQSLKDLLEHKKKKEALAAAAKTQTATAGTQTQTATQTAANTTIQDGSATELATPGMWHDFWEATESKLEAAETTHHMEWASLAFTDDERVKPAKVANTNKNSSAEQSKNIATGRSLVFAEASSASGRIPSARIGMLSRHYGAHAEGIVFDDYLGKKPSASSSAAVASSSSSSSTDVEESSSSAKVSASEAAARKDAAIKSGEALVDVDEIKHREFRNDACLPKMVEAVELVENVIANFGQPTLEGLINVMTFLRSWTTLQELCGGHLAALRQLDENLGVAPVSWMVHFRDDWERRPHVRNSFFTFLNFVDPTSTIPELAQRVRNTFASHATNPRYPVNTTLTFTSQVLQFQMLRSMLAQAAQYATNRDASEAIETNRWRDPLTGAAALLEHYHELRVKRLVAAAVATAQADASMELVQQLLSTPDIFEYIALLSGMGIHSGHRNYAVIIHAFGHPTAPARPLAALKLAVFLTGKFVDPSTGVVVRVLPFKQYVPGRKVLSQYHRSWGSAYKVVDQLVYLAHTKYQPPQ